MTDLEEFHKFIHQHLVVLFLLLDKHVMMFSREIITTIETKGLTLRSSCQLIISLEVLIQLEEDLEGSLESLQSFYPTSEVGM